MMQHMIYTKEQHMSSTKRAPSNNVEKFAKLNPQLTEIKTFVSTDLGMIDLYVNPAMDVAISKDKKVIYRLNKDRTDVRAIVPNRVSCMDMRIDGVYTKCSRNFFLAHLFSETSPYSNDEKNNTSGNKVTKVRRGPYVKSEFKFDNFNHENTYVDNSTGNNLVKNKDINVHFDMDNRTFYNFKGQVISSARGLKSSIYVAYKRNDRWIRKTMLQDHVIAMMYGLKVPSQSMVKLIDESKPLTKDNIRVVNKAIHMQELEKSQPKNLSMSKAKQDQSKNIIASYITEDFRTFTNQDEALDHQIKVEKAKDVAQLIISSEKVGYDLAEKAFLRIMEIKRSDVFYKNFIDVVNNNNGILEVKKELVEIDLNVNIDNLILESANKENALNLVCEIKDRINQLRML